jgi:outer membrane protein assembly factor BamA
VHPHTLGSALSLGSDLFNDVKTLVPGLTRKDVGFAETARAPLTAHWHAYVGYRLDDITADPPAALARSTAPVPLAPGIESAVRAGVEYSTLDTRILPTRGTNIGASIDYADPHLGSDIELARMSAWASTHQPLGPFILHAGGTASALSSPGAIPLTERLYLDGSSQLRGFAPGSIGPVGGGTVMFTGTASVELPVWGSLSVEGFADYAWISGFHGVSTGFGLIWRSPLGPLHLDFAFPLGGAGGLVFGIGSRF